MVEILQRRKDYGLADFQEPKPWEKTQDWSNPFDSGEASLRRQRQEERKRRKKKKKKARSHRHRMTEEEYSEISSKADTMLDDLLGEDIDKVSPTMTRVQEESKGGAGQPPKGAAANPFDDSAEEEDMNGEEINKEEYNALMKGIRNNSHESSNPFKEEKNDKQLSPPQDADDSTIEPPPPASSGNNPFEDEYVAESDAFEDQEEERSNPVPKTPPRDSLAKNSKVDEEDLERQPTDTTDEPVESETSAAEEEEEEERDGEEEGNDGDDIIESSKRLLRMADQRIQYQQHNDEVRELKETINGMKHQAEAMSEQLRRAVETKCDLVLAQTEMERCHEQDLIAKDDEIRDMKLYVQEVLENQAQTELNFMNEIASLSSRLDETNEKHKKEAADKDNLIAQLEAKVKSLQTEPVRGSPPPESLRSRFIGFSGSSRAPISVI